MSQKNAYWYGIYRKGSRNIPIPTLSDYDEGIIESPQVFRNSTGEVLGVIIVQVILVVIALLGALMKRVNPLTYLENQLAQARYPVLFVASLFTLLFLYSLWKFLDRRPQLTISKEGIRIRRRLFSWKSIRYIDMISYRSIHPGRRPSSVTHFLYLYDSGNRRFKVSVDGLDAKSPAIVKAISNFRAYAQQHSVTNK